MSVWLTERLKPGDNVRLRSGLVESEGGFAVRSDSEHRAPEQLFPYGFASAAQSGRPAVMLNGYCVGLASAPDPTLEEGEVRLYSAGGAEILLKNNGQVVVNGQVFAPKEAG